MKSFLVTLKEKSQRPLSEALCHAHVEHLKQLKQQGIPSQEITRLKQKQILEWESKEKTNYQVAKIYRTHRDHIKKTGNMINLIQIIEKIDSNTISTVLQKHFPEQSLFAILRPYNIWEIILRLGLIIILSSIIALPIFNWLKKRRKIG